MNIKNLVRKVGTRQEVVVQEDVPFIHILDRFTKSYVDSIFVLENNCLSGIITGKGILSEICKNKRFSSLTLAKDIMVPNPKSLSYDATYEQALFLFMGYKVNILPVVQDREYMGALYFHEVAEQLIDKKNFLINQLTIYICGIGVQPHENNSVQLEWAI